MEQPGWQWRRVLMLPYRPAFLAGFAVLGLASLWWAAVQVGWPRAAPDPVIAPELVHAALMSFGFMPLFFAGFLFTAAPRWLGAQAPPARSLLAPLAAQGGGWLLWLAGAYCAPAVAMAGAALATVGLATLTLCFVRMLLASRVPDRKHPAIVAGALVAGCACQAGLVIALALGAGTAARAFVLSGLWSFVVVVFAAVAHRMLPFFTAGAVPALESRWPDAVLHLLLAVALLQAVAPWLPAGAAAWTLLRASGELLAGGLLLALAFAWARARRVQERLLVMVHLALVWFGLALVLAAASHALGPWTHGAVLPLAGLHALAMGGLGSLMLAMVTRVSCSHGGRKEVIDTAMWLLFRLLQAAALLRIAASAFPAARAWLLPLAAVAWAAVMLAWGLRHGAMLGRAQGAPGPARA